MTQIAEAEGAPLDDPTEAKLAALTRHLENLGCVIVAFSGGIDSAFLLKVAATALKDRVVALTAVSPSLPDFEREEAIELARAFGVRHELIKSGELDNPSYSANSTDRCFYCKQELFRIAEPLKQQLGIPHLAIGTNVDDLNDHRPGLIAAKACGVLQPLVEVGFTKSEVRRCAQHLKIDIWDKPARACLSSRFPYGTRITEARLNRVATCETLLKDLGFRVFRARFHGDLLRIEIGMEEFDKIGQPDVRQSIVDGCRNAGFRFVSLDLEPHRSGRLNDGFALE